VKPYEPAIVPVALPYRVSEKRGGEAPAEIQSPEESRSPGASGSGSNAVRVPTETEGDFEERFQSRLMQFLHTQMDPPAAPDEALPVYPGPVNSMVV
jgi:hypothetical protein